METGSYEKAASKLPNIKPFISHKAIELKIAGCEQPRNENKQGYFR